MILTLRQTYRRHPVTVPYLLIMSLLILALVVL